MLAPLKVSNPPSPTQGPPPLHPLIVSMPVVQGSSNFCAGSSQGDGQTEESAGEEGVAGGEQVVLDLPSEAAEQEEEEEEETDAIMQPDKQGQPGEQGQYDEEGQATATVAAIIAAAATAGNPLSPGTQATLLSRLAQGVEVLLM